MKETIIVAILLSVATASGDTTLHYWRLEEGAGTNVTDSVGTAHGIVILPDPSPGAGDSSDSGWSTNTPCSLLRQTAQTNKTSLHFPGYLSGILIAPDVSLDLGTSFTIELFFMLNFQPGVDYPISFLDFDNFAEGVWLRMSYWKMDTGPYAFQLFTSDSGGGGSSMLWFTNFVPTTGQWHHCALVKSGASYEIFLDGISIVSGDFNPTSDGSYYFGTNGTHYLAGGFRPASGRMDEFRISASALSPDQFLLSPWQPVFAAASIDKDVLTLLVSNVAYETTTILERTQALFPQTVWDTVAVIMVKGTTTNWQDTTLSNRNGFYRAKRYE